MGSISLQPLVSLIDEKIAAFDQHWQQVFTFSAKACDFLQTRRYKLLELRYIITEFESVLQKKEKDHPETTKKVANALLEFVPQFIDNQSPAEEYTTRTQSQIRKLIGINHTLAGETASGDLTVVGPILSLQATSYILFRALVFKHPLNDLGKEFLLLAAGLGIGIIAALSLWKKRQTGEISDAAMCQISLLSLVKDPQLTQALSLAAGRRESFIEVMDCPATYLTLSMQHRFSPAPLDGVPPPPLKKTKDISPPPLVNSGAEINYNNFLKPPRHPLLKPKAAAPNHIIPRLQL